MYQTIVFATGAYLQTSHWLFAKGTSPMQTSVAGRQTPHPSRAIEEIY